MNKVYYSNGEFEKVMHKLSDLTNKVEDIPEEETRELIYQILKHFDAIHREALHRMWQYIRYKNPEMEGNLLKDYSIRHLLALYDLETFHGIESANHPVSFIPEENVKNLNR